MLAVYAKAMSVKTLETAVASKLTAADTLTMLAPYAKVAYTIDSSFFKSQLATKLSVADSTKYVTQTQLAGYNFTSGGGSGGASIDTMSISNRINLKAPLASPTFSGTVSTSAINTGTISASSITTPVLASSPINLIYSGSTINWNPTQGLNTAITLTQNSTLSFTTPPPAGSYGTIVLKQDATGNRTIELPTITNISNIVLGSTSTSTVALSTAANSKDILNFYYDGTNCYWNIGKGYGTAVTSASTNLVTGITGTLAIANGGTGATSKSSAFDALSPLTTSGDIIYGGTSGSGTRLAKGTDGQVLQLSSGLPSWQNGFNKETEKVNFGSSTGSFNQANFTTAVGPYAGQQNQGINATAIGRNAGNSGQGERAVAIGLVAGANSQGNEAIAIGNGAGATSQGVSSIAIGLGAGNSSQHANSIVINATGANLNTANTSALYIAPIRAATSNNVLLYNTTTKEITTSSDIAGNSATATLATTAITAGNITATSNATLNSLVNLNTVGTITSGTISLTTNISTTGTLTSGTVTYPNTKGASGQVLSTTGTGTLTWTTMNGGVPYSGAIGAVDLGPYDLKVNGLTIGIGSGSLSNTVMGTNALFSNTNGINNNAFGNYSLLNNTTGINNTAIGYNSLTSNTTGANNGAFGYFALSLNTSGWYNNATGGNALYSNTTGWYNTAFGRRALYNNTTGNHNTAIGNYANVASNNLNNATAIGDSAIVSNSNTIQLGNSSVTNVNTSGTLTAGAVTYPNTLGTNGQVLSTTVSGTLTWTTVASGGSSTHAIGDVYGGGIVFYVWDGGVHGLIAPFNTISRQSTSPLPPITEANIALNGTLSGVTASGLLAGKNNTLLIIANQGNGTYGASYCYNYQNVTSKTFNSIVYTFPQYGDWYLPSAYELALFRTFLMNRNSTYTNYGNNLIYYLGTAGNGNDYAWGKYLSSTMGTGSNSNKYSNNYLEGNSESFITYNGSGIESDRLVVMPIRSF